MREWWNRWCSSTTNTIVACVGLILGVFIGGSWLWETLRPFRLEDFSGADTYGVAYSVEASENGMMIYNDTDGVPTMDLTLTYPTHDRSSLNVEAMSVFVHSCVVMRRKFPNPPRRVELSFNDMDGNRASMVLEDETNAWPIPDPKIEWSKRSPTFEEIVERTKR